MLDMELLQRLGKEAGFTQIAYLKRSTIRLKPEVRQMCQSNSCGAYGKKWTCPPGCGTLEELRQRLDGYEEGILVQTVGQLEDEFDYEAMMETEALHKENFLNFIPVLRDMYPGLLPVGAGACTKCKTCSYPDAPCRFPDQAYPSMEAYGMLVTQVCKANGMEYYYGPMTMAYTSCYLLR